MSESKKPRPRLVINLTDEERRQVEELKGPDKEWREFLFELLGIPFKKRMGRPPKEQD